MVEPQVYLYDISYIINGSTMSPVVNPIIYNARLPAYFFTLRNDLAKRNRIARIHYKLN